MVGQISHDLRTPLNSINIMLRLAIDTSKEIPQIIKDDYLIPAFKNSKHLISIVNDILDFTQEDFKKELNFNFKKIDLLDELKVILKSF